MVKSLPAPVKKKLEEAGYWEQNDRDLTKATWLFEEALDLMVKHGYDRVSSLFLAITLNYAVVLDRARLSYRATSVIEKALKECENALKAAENTSDGRNRQNDALYFIAQARIMLVDLQIGDTLPKGDVREETLDAASAMAYDSMREQWQTPLKKRAVSIPFTNATFSRILEGRRECPLKAPPC